ncbi:MAG: FliM/FliN family flagellar motor switch protein [Polyangiales bacterium]
MLSEGPNFSPYPIGALRRVTAGQAALESALARWIRVRPLGARVAKLAGGPVAARVIGGRVDVFDPHAGFAEVRTAGASILVACAGRPIRALAQRLLGGQAELGAPRALTAAEEAIWVLVVAAAIEDTGVAAEVWPSAQRAPSMTTHLALELAIEGAATGTIVAYVPRSMSVRVPPPRALPDWAFDLPIVVGRCLLDRAAIGRLALRDVITVERELSLVVGDGTIALTAAPQAVEARVAIEYVPAQMSPALADTAQLELTVQLGTTRMSLRQLGELAPGAIVSLGRPLAGPFEVRAAGRLIGRGELVDVDGELGVRIVSLEE